MKRIEGDQMEPCKGILLVNDSPVFEDANHVENAVH